MNEKPLGLERTSEPVDIRKVYFDLANDDNDWDFVRVPRGPDESADPLFLFFSQDTGINSQVNVDDR
ncbi:hypothetical protein BASA62_009890 [Batrachochytrium salamandrivorans]|nr:hypothetical protein BASA62_009890 [Batrachochytrium salamandrivorans]